ncbi:hypothetical protein ACQR1Y_12335 [Bradyrhizobium sp. HKCCYLRH3099]|uniref:hypothetical protein n=1 Tax=unclassified Bradyrhizobium TaxID=2631580 RepID=UPI003EBCB052
MRRKISAGSETECGLAGQKPRNSADSSSETRILQLAMKGDPIRIIPHRIETIPDIGSFEVRFADGRSSVFFHWDDHDGRRAMSMSTTMTQDQARAAAQHLARTELNRLRGL